MDCNKDEAIRAKEIALRKFSDKDIMGAAKFALKAQKLYPELEGISHLVANFELHMSAKFRRNGEIDWYRILSVSPSADADTISKQYRKLALLIHPDKNREVGSESAFKLLSEAFRVLKDNNARSAYDQRTNIQQFQRNFPAHSKFVPVVPTPAAQTGYYSAAPNWSQFKKVNSNSGAQPSWNCSSAPSNNVTSQQKRPTVGACTEAPPRPLKKAKKSDKETCSSTDTRKIQERSTFWTSCSGCKMCYEYLLMCLNEYLYCPNCYTAFKAEEIPKPSIWENSDKIYSYSRPQNPSQLDSSSVATKISHADANNGNSKSKRQKLDGKPTKINNGKTNKPTKINNGKTSKTKVSRPGK